MNGSPCLNCMRVKDPAVCENKECKRWRVWFVQRWDSLRLQPRLQAERRPREMEGAVIGGVRYAMPHRVRDYFGKDPCGSCLCPRDLCVLPCRVKRDWLRLKEETLL